MPARIPTLSKSRFTYGLQCHRRLWWQAHEPRAPELAPGPVLQAIFRQGNDVGCLAREHIPGGILITFDGRAKTRAVAETEAAIASGASIIYEASVMHEGVFGAIDALSRDGSSAWTLTEVKSTTKVKEQHIADVAVQTWMELMHLNRACRYPDLSNLFVRSDITHEVEAYLVEVGPEIEAQRKVLAGPIPAVPPGPHCTAPYDCPFLGRCTPPIPRGHVSELYRIRASRTAALQDDGVELISEIPPGDVEHNAMWMRQQQAAESGEVVVDPALASAVPSMEGTVGYLDFETIMPAIPVWNGCRPYDQLPVQLSLHVKRGEQLEHHTFLAEGPDDPREALATALIDAAQDCDVIYAYNASFEQLRIDELAAALPSRETELHAIRSRIVDLLPILRDHVYHPGFRGSFSLKAVLPVLVPELDYSDLDIASGMVASKELEEMLLGAAPASATEVQALRESLLAYCERDTLALVKLHEWLASAC
jgi:hypothetical protein